MVAYDFESCASECSSVLAFQRETGFEVGRNVLLGPYTSPILVLSCCGTAKDRWQLPNDGLGCQGNAGWWWHFDVFSGESINKQTI